MNDDPFAFDDDDRTVLQPVRPTRGGSGSGGSDGPGGYSAGLHSVSSLPPLGGINPLEKAASRLLMLLLSIRHTATHPNPDQLRNHLVQELNEFKHAAHDVLNDQKKVTYASYVMCTALDEAAMNTPWGHQSNWAQHNLLTTFHNEVIGGERFFTMLKRLGKDPQENIYLLELMYVCLSLGYEGVYRIKQNGQNTLAKVRVWLYEIINSVRSSPDNKLSLYWQGSGVQESRLPKLTVVWVIAAAALALCSLVYIGYRYSLASSSDTAIAGFFGIKPAALQVNSIAPPIAPPASSTTESSNNEGKVLTLQQLLQPQIDLKLVEVTDSFNEGNVRILGNNLFASGRTELNADLEPLVQSIATALDQFKGAILVTGHSDNVPIRSGRFSSNLELSQLRAASVAQRIAAPLTDPTRVSAEGRGSLVPIADNSTASGRAQNRRVEVSIFY